MTRYTVIVNGGEPQIVEAPNLGEALVSAVGIGNLWNDDVHSLSVEPVEPVGEEAEGASTPPRQTYAAHLQQFLMRLYEWDGWDVASLTAGAYWRREIMNAIAPLAEVTEADVAWARKELERLSPDGAPGSPRKEEECACYLQGRGWLRNTLCPIHGNLLARSSEGGGDHG